MSVKRHIIMGMAAGLIGVALISGGTVAYFSDNVTTETKILSGILDLDISEEDELKFEFTNKKPGDVFEYNLTLVNAGTLDMKDIILETDYEISDGKASILNNDFDKQIMVKQLEVNSKPVIDEAMTLRDLKNASITLAENIEVDETVPIFAEFTFIKTEADQNAYQGNMLKLNWTFEAMQED